MILIHRLKKIKPSKVVREIISDSLFFLVFFVLGVCFVFSKIESGGEEAMIISNIDGTPESLNLLSGPSTQNDKKEGNFVASSRGKYFYLIGSSKANSLSEQNKVYFDTDEDAKKQGFKPYIGN